ncbi:MAG: hypothetical protein OEZ68_11935 [Gammaproteobacteria bacterium]|nr:hypothetical protein [Gammaproteobacteria bacterium]MDH5801505.1 hypothetical protein [Gammaproteobacteria bacterium]
MADKTFGEAFRANMESMGLPVPSTVFGSVSAALGTVGALAGAIAKVGATATVSEIFLTVSLGAGGTAVAAAIGEVVAVLGACAAAFYVGACIGSLLVAAYETLDVFEMAKVASFFSDIQDKLGQALDKFMAHVLATYPKSSPIRQSVVLLDKFV